MRLTFTKCRSCRQSGPVAHYPLALWQVGSKQLDPLVFEQAFHMNFLLSGLSTKKRLLYNKEAASSDWYTMDITDTSVSHFSRL